MFAFRRYFTVTWASLARQLLLAEVLEHLAAFLRAVVARLGTSSHVLIVWHLLTRGGAIIATLRTALQHVAREGTATGTEGCARLAAFATIGTELRRFRMFLFALGEQRQTMLEAGVTLNLTVGTNLSTFHEMLGVFGTSRLAKRSDDDDGQRSQHQGEST